MDLQASSSLKAKRDMVDHVYDVRTCPPAACSAMRAVKGILFTCDPAVKQILLAMNERQNFIIEDLDDYHLVIKADEEGRVRRELEVELEKNTFSLDTNA
jgi:TFIIH basal transcription factor complex TTD-A subunit